MLLIVPGLTTLRVVDDKVPLPPLPIPTPPPGFDAVRTGWNGIGLALYALEPGGDVTLEVHSEGEVYSFRAPTAEDAFALAFPPQPPVDVFG